MSLTIYKPFEKKEFHNRLINLPKDVQKKILSDAKEIMTYNWPSIPATAYLDYKRRHQELYFLRSAVESELHGEELSVNQ